MKDFIKVMKALSDPNRVKIVKMLQRKTMCVCEIQAALQIAQPSVSKHLKILALFGFGMGRAMNKLELSWGDFYVIQAPNDKQMIGIIKIE